MPNLVGRDVVYRRQHAPRLEEQLAVWSMSDHLTTEHPGDTAVASEMGVDTASGASPYRPGGSRAQRSGSNLP